MVEVESAWVREPTLPAATTCLEFGQPRFTLGVEPSHVGILSLSLFSEGFDFSH